MAEFLRRIIVPVVCCVHARVMPEALDGIEFGRIGRKQKDLDSFAMFAKPLIDFRFFMIRRVVLNEVDPVAAFPECGQQMTFQKTDICFGVEVFCLMMVDELAAVKSDRSENLLCVPLPACGNFRL